MSVKWKDQIANRLQALERWFATPYGQLVWREQAVALERVLAREPISELVQIGGVPLFSKACDTGVHFMQIDPLVRPALVGHRVGAEFSLLPLEAESVDLLLCVHAHELVIDPVNLFLELHRVIKPDGQLMLFSVNRLSLWGIVERLKRQRRVPWCVDLSRAHRTDYPFKKCAQQTVCFRPDVGVRRRLQQLAFLESLGKLCCPQHGAIQIDLLKKQDLAVTPLRSTTATTRSSL